VSDQKVISTPTTVVNIKRSKCEVFCGRGSFFGNQYRIGRDGDRGEVIEKYREWFNKKLTNSEFRVKVLALKGKKLGCWCKPLRCHCDVIVEYLENYEK